MMGLTIEENTFTHFITEKRNIKLTNILTAYETMVPIAAPEIPNELFPIKK
jgi:hypothetical protein